MTKIINLNEVSLDSIRLPANGSLPDLAKLTNDHPQSSWALIEENQLIAHCSLWTENVPSYQGYRTAALGHFFAQNQKSGQCIVQQLTCQLAAQGFDYVVGPMNGNTWRSYRLVSERGEQPPFFLESVTPCDWLTIFERSGFETIANYSSAQSFDLYYPDRSADRFAAKAEQMGMVVRSFDRNRSEAELTALYELSLRSFANNFLYSPLALPDFLAMYQPLLPYLVPDFFLLAEHKGRLVGFLFAIPDYLQKARGEPIDALIIKTLARSPERQYAGMGSYLAQLVHRTAAQRGFRSVIHALMHDDNASHTISNRSARTIRRYALVGKKI